MVGMKEHNFVIIAGYYNGTVVFPSSNASQAYTQPAMFLLSLSSNFLWTSVTEEPVSNNIRTFRPAINPDSGSG